MSRRQAPACRHMRGALARLGKHFARDQQSEFDADAGETDAVAAHLGTGGDVMVSRQLPAPHTTAVVDDGHC